MVEDSAPPTRSIPEPRHYSAIRPRPHSLGGWLVGVVLAGMVQAMGFTIPAAFLGLTLPLFLPLPLILGSLVFSTYTGMVIVFVCGGAVVGHYYPHYAVYRGAFAFLCGVSGEIILAKYIWLQPTIDMRGEEDWFRLAFVIVGTMSASLASTIGGHWHRGREEWLREEWRELRNSTGISSHRD